MRVLNPNEYKLENQDATIDDYLDYLNFEYDSLANNLMFLESINDNSNASKELEEQIEEIQRISLIIEDNLGKVIINSIKSLEVLELQHFFSNTANDLHIRKELLLKKQTKLVHKLNSLKDDYQTFLDTLENQKELFDNRDAQEFFEIGTILEFFNDCIYSKEFDQEKLKDYIEEVLLEACRELNIKFEWDAISIYSEDILELILNYRKVASRISAPNNDFAKKLLSYEKGSIFSILTGVFKRNDIKRIINNLFRITKMNTTFYKNLPEYLQNKLCLEDFRGETFTDLKQIYRKLKCNENPSKIQNIVDEIEKINEQLSKISHELSNLALKEQRYKNFLNNREEMQKELIKRISLISGMETIDETIHKISRVIDEESYAKKEADVLKISKELKELNITIKKIESILKDPKYQRYFCQEASKNVHRKLKTSGISVSESVVEPFISTEEKRLEQIMIMIQTERRLKAIQEEIRHLKKGTLLNLFLNPNLISSTYKEQMDSLYYEYEDVAEACYQKMYEKNYFHINSPSKETLASNRQVSQDIREKITYPKDFYDMTNLKDEQVFPDFDGDFFSSDVKTEFCPRGNWNLAMEHISNCQMSLIYSLFDYTIDKNGFYQFSLNDEDYKKIITIQKNIIKIFKREYNIRLNARKVTKDTISSSEIEKLKRELNLSSISKKSLEELIALTRKKSQRLLYILSQNSEKCKKLGIKLPSELPVYRENEAKDFLIKDLNINGINSLEEAIFYKEVLEGLKDYQYDSDTVGDYYRNLKK